MKQKLSHCEYFVRGSITDLLFWITLKLTTYLLQTCLVMPKIGRKQVFSPFFHRYSILVFDSPKIPPVVEEHFDLGVVTRVAATVDHPREAHHCTRNFFGNLARAHLKAAVHDNCDAVIARFLEYEIL